MCDMQQSKIISATLELSGDFVVTRRYPSMAVYGNGTPCPDRIVKDIYRSVDGSIQLVGTVAGRHIPSYTVPEKFEF